MNCAGCNKDLTRAGNILTLGCRRHTLKPPWDGGRTQWFCNVDCLKVWLVWLDHKSVK